MNLRSEHSGKLIASLRVPFAPSFFFTTFPYFTISFSQPLCQVKLSFLAPSLSCQLHSYGASLLLRLCVVLTCHTRAGVESAALERKLTSTQASVVFHNGEKIPYTLPWVIRKRSCDLIVLFDCLHAYKTI